MIPQVHDTAPDPAPQALLAPVEDAVHLPADLRRLLHAVQALARVHEPVAVPFAQQVLLRQVPELEHVRGDLSADGAADGRQGRERGREGGTEEAAGGGPRRRREAERREQKSGSRKCSAAQRAPPSRA